MAVIVCWHDHVASLANQMYSDWLTRKAVTWAQFSVKSVKLPKQGSSHHRQYPSNTQRARHTPQDGYVQKTCHHRASLTMSSSSLRRRRPRHQPRKKSVFRTDLPCRSHLDRVISIAARARGEYLRTHFKNMREVAAALSSAFMTK